MNAVTSVDLYVAVVVNPRYTESNHALRLGHSLDQGFALEFRMTVYDGLDRFKYFFHCL
jgi:hypothetical protein